MAYYRIKCYNCGQVSNLLGDQPCPHCGVPLQCTGNGIIHLYRMGSPIGLTSGFGIYINGEPMGHIGNRENIYIVLPFGTFNIHLTCGLNRSCEDAVVTLTPENPIAYVKGSIRMGFWSNHLRVSVVTREEMPLDEYEFKIKINNC